MFDNGTLRPAGQNESARFGTGDLAEHTHHQFVHHREAVADRPLAYIVATASDISAHRSVSDCRIRDR
ncbi:hypothetical protein [Streptomyces sp. NPDC056255]|uniref:hypothetical protein n=1 Tax=Streptomyces sp. NPDC056255 TaxID=3345764 RepID=UPI0035DC34C0